MFMQLTLLKGIKTSCSWPMRFDHSAIECCMNGKFSISSIATITVDHKYGWQFRIVDFCWKKKEKTKKKTNKREIVLSRGLSIESTCDSKRTIFWAQKLFQSNSSVKLPLISSRSFLSDDTANYWSVHFRVGAMFLWSMSKIVDRHTWLCLFWKCMYRWRSS